VRYNAIIWPERNGKHETVNWRPSGRWLKSSAKMGTHVIPRWCLCGQSMFHFCASSNPGYIWVNFASGSKRDPSVYFMAERRPLTPLASETVPSGRRLKFDLNLEAFMPLRSPFWLRCSELPPQCTNWDSEVDCTAKRMCREEGTGLDCFLCLYFEVIYAICKGLFIISCFSRAIL
jgi:hypothetical protein